MRFAQRAERRALGAPEALLASLCHVIRVDPVQGARAVMAPWPGEALVAFGGCGALSAGMRPTTHPSRERPQVDSAGGPGGLLDVDDAAVRLGVTVRFVRRLVAERRIPYVKVGKFVRFDPADVERWIDDHRIGQLELW